MINSFSRTELLIGKEGLEKLKGSKVAIFGVGGVGSSAVEALARAGIGRFVLIDNDVVDVTNINRQILATFKTIGMPKVEVMKDRIIDINPNAIVEIYQIFYLPGEDTNMIVGSDYVIDAVDTVAAKIGIILKCKEMKIPVISSMGAGNKLDPTRFEIADIYSTSVDPLCRVIRTELRKRNVKDLKVVYSKEQPIKVDNPDNEDFGSRKKKVIGSISFVPAAAGLIIAGEVVKDLI